jgi:glycosyltransferase involved in cell wall biosynthesis
MDLLYLKMQGIRIIGQEHNSFWEFAYQKRLNIHHLARAIYPICDAVTCLSRMDATLWRASGCGRTVFMPNPPTFSPETTPPAAVKEDNLNILCVARFESVQKRPHLAIEMFAMLHRSLPQARLICVGSWMQPPVVQLCHRLVEQYGLKDAVQILDFQADMEKFYRQAAVVVVPSAYEGWGMQIMEAKALGLPVVHFEMNYLETVGPGCIAVPKGNVRAMAAAVYGLLKDPQKRRQLGEDGRRSLENFTMERTMERWKDLLMAILQGNGAVGKISDRDQCPDGLSVLETSLREMETWVPGLIQPPQKQG